jgi:hypothetical protein
MSSSGGEFLVQGFQWRQELTFGDKQSVEGAFPLVTKSEQSWWININDKAA